MHSCAVSILRLDCAIGSVEQCNVLGIYSIFSIRNNNYFPSAVRKMCIWKSCAVMLYVDSMHRAPPQVEMYPDQAVETELFFPVRRSYTLS